MLVERARASRSDAWAYAPAELAARLGAGDHVFGALQRPWRWTEHGPELSPRLQRQLAELGCELPRIVARQSSTDGASKLLLGLRSPRGGEDHIELVHMPRAVRNAR